MKKTMLPILISAACLMLITVFCAAAQADDVPRISIQELKALMDKGESVIIIDVQPKEIYAEGHIKGALSMPASRQIELEDVWPFPGDARIVTYCDCGPGESDSVYAARQIMRFGYDNVRVLSDPAIAGWKAAGYPVEKK